MRTTKLTFNEFAKWLYEIGLNCEMYNSDVFHDIHTILQARFAFERDNGPDKVQYWFFTRNTGTSLALFNETEFDIIEHYLEHNKEAYLMELNFLNNARYFATIHKLT